jgi:hypothetical protein
MPVDEALPAKPVMLEEHVREEDTTGFARRVSFMDFLLHY